MRGVAPGIAAMARYAGALTAPDIDADRGALTVRPLRLPPREGLGGPHGDPAATRRVFGAKR
jgi:hypothetical protein